MERNGEAELIVLVYAGVAGTYTLAISGPRHGDPGSRGRICTKSVVARRSLEQKTRI